MVTRDDLERIYDGPIPRHMLENLERELDANAYKEQARSALKTARQGLREGSLMMYREYRNTARTFLRLRAELLRPAHPEIETIKRIGAALGVGE